MSQGDCRVHGALRACPDARSLAVEVRRIHQRYVDEVVVPYGLCPHLTDAAHAFGTFCVMVDRELDLELARSAVLDAGSSVVHVVFPCAHGPSSEFERFGSRLDDALKGATSERLVHATFHPALAGGTEDAFRLIGLLRRAPDPFVQFVPAEIALGLKASASKKPGDGKSHAQRTYERLLAVKPSARPLDDLVRRVEAIHADRAAAYAPFLSGLAP